MEPVPGYLSLPRWAGFSLPNGAFFSALVEAEVAPGQWRIKVDGRMVVVHSQLPLQPGQKLRLVAEAHSEGGRWRLLQDAVVSGMSVSPSLWAAFLTQGLTTAQERLESWARWLKGRTGPSDLETWAASLEARGAGPNASPTDALLPWLDWQAALELGLRQSPPDSDDTLDWWNLTRTVQGTPWLLMPLRWEYEGQRDAGLLKAHWDPSTTSIDRWNLTAAPAGVPFRIEAQNRSSCLFMIWRFFHPADRLWASEWMESLGKEAWGEEVEVRIEGPAPPPRGIDVQA